MRIGCVPGRGGVCFALFVGIVLGGTACGPVGGAALRLDPAQPKAAPRGYIAFCTRDPALCEGGGGPSSMTLTATRWRQLLDANDELNRALDARQDTPPAGTADDWRLPTAATSRRADCEDYVLAKKARLVGLGWPKSALRIAVVDQLRGPLQARRHAVLLADTSEGVFVLDNLMSKILRWTDAPYEWVAVQTPADPERWAGVKRASFN